MKKEKVKEEKQKAQTAKKENNLFRNLYGNKYCMYRWRTGGKKQRKLRAKEIIMWMLIIALNRHDFNRTNKKKISERRAGGIIH